MCNGDSGGGFYIKVNKVYYLRGIVSSSLIKDGGCDVSKYAVYTNVLKFRGWIKNIVGAAQESSTQRAMVTIQSDLFYFPTEIEQTKTTIPYSTAKTGRFALIFKFLYYMKLFVHRSSQLLSMYGTP